MFIAAKSVIMYKVLFQVSDHAMHVTRLHGLPDEESAFAGCIRGNTEASLTLHNDTERIQVTAALPAKA
jgi:hypothetical protein